MRYAPCAYVKSRVPPSAAHMYFFVLGQVGLQMLSTPKRPMLDTRRVPSFSIRAQIPKNTLPRRVCIPFPEVMSRNLLVVVNTQ